MQEKENGTTVLYSVCDELQEVQSSVVGAQEKSCRQLPVHFYYHYFTVCNQMCSKRKAAHDGGEQQQKAQQLDEPKKKGMALLCYDLKLKQLIPIKILFFVISSSKLTSIF